MTMGSPSRWPWLHSILTSPGRSKSLILPEPSPSLLALHAALRKGFLISNPLLSLRDPGLATILCSEARLGLPWFLGPQAAFSGLPRLQTYIPLAPSLGLTWEPGMKAQGQPPKGSCFKR